MAFMFFIQAMQVLRWCGQKHKMDPFIRCSTCMRWMACVPEVHMWVKQNDGKICSQSDVDAIHIAVKSNELKWLPNGSELQMASANPKAIPKTYTSFSSSQDSFPEFASRPIRPKYDDITIAVLGAGQVTYIITHLNWTIQSPIFIQLTSSQIRFSFGKHKTP